MPGLYNYDELVANGLLKERDELIQVKKVGENNWTVACDYPYTYSLITPTRPYDVGRDGTVNLGRGNEVNNNNLNDKNMGYEKPKSNMVWAILCTLFCCLPFGIVAIVNASKVDSLYYSGDYAGAQRASDDAKKFSQYGMIIGGVIYGLYLGMLIFAAASNY